MSEVFFLVYSYVCFYRSLLFLMCSFIIFKSIEKCYSCHWLGRVGFHRHATFVVNAFVGN
jgi:hypothetical protein